MAHDPLILYLKEPTKPRFADLVATRREMVLNAAWRVTGDAHVAEDVAQDVLLKLLDTKLDPDGVRSPTGLLITMTVNAARSRLRGEGRRRDREQEAVRRREEAGPMDSRMLTEVREAVSELPEELRDCVELRYFGGLPLADVAKATGLALRTVNQQLRKARDRMQARLAGVTPPGVLAYLAGEQEEGLPALEPSQRFLERTDRMAAEIRVPAGRTPGAGAVAAVAAACVLLVVALFLLLGKTDGNGSAPAPEDVAGTDLPGAAGPTPEPDSEGPGGGVADGTPAGSGTAKDAGSLPPIKDSATGFSIRVTDKHGNLLREGTLLIKLSGLPDLDLVAELRPWEGLLEPQSLEKANPLTVAGLPAAADGLGLYVSALVPGRPPSVKTELNVKKGKSPGLTVVVPLAGEIPVRVLSSLTGKPLEGASVVSLTELRRRKILGADALGTTGPGSAVTGHDGLCRLGGLGMEPHDLEVHARGHVAARVFRLPLEKEAVLRLEPIRDPATVLVTVVGPEGQALAGVGVTLGADGGSIETALQTDATGTCRFASVVPGFHVVHVEFEGWFKLTRARGWGDRGETVLSRRIEVKPGEEHCVRIGFLPATSSITAEVRDPEGAPRAGVEVRLHGPRDVSAETDEAGKVFFDEMPPGEYDVYLGGWDLSGEIELEEGEGKVLALVAGQATIGGRAAPGALICVHGPASEFGRAGEDGAFEVGSVAPGTYKVHALTKGLISARVTVVVKGSESPPPVELKMVPSGRLLLTFREPDRPVLAEAEIRLFNEQGEKQFLNKDRSGKFDRTTPPILPGRYEIEVTLPGGEPRRTTVEVSGGRDTKVELGAP